MKFFAPLIHFLFHIGYFGPLVMGILKHDDGSQWSVLVNRDLHKETNAALRFASATKIEELSPHTAKLSAVPLTDKSLQCDLPPGGIKVLKLSQ